MISAVVITKNEEKNLNECLKSLSFCDELIVIDDYSTDKTQKIALKNGAKVYKRHLNSNFSEQRNFGLSKTSCEWVLFIDADEVVSNELSREIQDKLDSSGKNGFYITRKDLFLGRELKHGETNIKLLRLCKKNAGKWKRSIHEYWDIKENIGELNSEILHYKNDSISDFVNKISYYSTLHAKENVKEKKNVSLFKIIIFPVGKFINSYILKLGILDGTPGFIMALMMSFHSFLSWTKIWIS